LYHSNLGYFKSSTPMRYNLMSSMDNGHKEQSTITTSSLWIVINFPQENK
jgi:hypothetical protein